MFNGSLQLNVDMMIRLIKNLLQLKPCLGIFRGRVQNRGLLLLLAACLVTHLHWHLVRQAHNTDFDSCKDPDESDIESNVQTRAETPQCNVSMPQPSRSEEDVLGCMQNNREILYKDDVRVLGKPLTEKVFLTIGIPTVERVHKNKTVSYIEGTLDSLVANMSPEDMKEVLLVVFLADFNAASRARLRRMVETRYKNYIAMNLIHVIEAPRQFYPQLTGLPSTFNDKPERMFWRSKQNIDYVFLLGYCQDLSQYYMQLEDDVTTEPKFLQTIKDVIQRNAHLKWPFLQFSFWGFIGKFFRNDDLRYVSKVLRTFYSDLPCDWNLLTYRKFRGDTGAQNAYFGGELFHHVGRQSSSLGT